MESQYLENRLVLNCGEETAARVDAEVMRIMKDCYEKSKALLESHLEELHKLAKYLYEKETITGKEFMRILKETQEKKEAAGTDEAPEPSEEGEAFKETQADMAAQDNEIK